MAKQRIPSFRIGRIGGSELTALLVISSVSDVFLSYPARLVTEGASAAWMIPLFSGAIVLAIWLMVDGMMKKTHTLNVVDELTNWLPFPVISAVLVILSLYILLQTSLIMREFTEAIIATVLPSTPSSLIALSFLLVSVYFSSKGIEAISRAAIMFMYFFVAGVVTLLVLPMSWVHTVEWLPLWGTGIPRIATYSVLNTSIYFLVLALILLSPALRKESLRRKTGVYSIVISSVIIVAFMLVLLGAFSVPITEKMTYPIYQLSRLIYVSRFVQRLEAIFVFLWTSAAVIKMGFGLWLTTYLFAYSQKMPVYRPLIWIFAMLVYVLMFVPPDLPTVLSLAGGIYETYGGIFSVGVPILFVLLIYVRKTRNANRSMKRGARE